MDITRLNVNMGGAAVNGFTGDVAIFAEVVAEIGAALPTDYIDFIMQVDGGHPEINCFRPLNGAIDNFFEVDYFYPLRKEKQENIIFVLNKWHDLLGRGALPIGRDSGGNQIYLQVSKESAPVWLLLHDDHMKRIKLAENFCDFINNLIINPDYI